PQRADHQVTPMEHLDRGEETNRHGNIMPTISHSPSFLSVCFSSVSLLSLSLSVSLSLSLCFCLSVSLSLHSSTGPNEQHKGPLMLWPCVNETGIRHRQSTACTLCSGRPRCTKPSTVTHRHTHTHAT